MCPYQRASGGFGEICWDFCSEDDAEVFFFLGDTSISMAEVS